jgi:hypothetical protein
MSLSGAATTVPVASGLGSIVGDGGGVVGSAVSVGAARVAVSAAGACVALSTCPHAETMNKSIANAAVAIYLIMKDSSLCRVQMDLLGS